LDELVKFINFSAIMVGVYRGKKLKIDHKIVF